MKNLDSQSIHVPREIDGERFDGPWEIVEPLEKLRAKYYNGGYPSIDFDLYAAQRRQNRGWLSRIEGADVYATLLMNSAIKKVEVDRLMARSAGIARRLARVPDANLSGVELSRLKQPLVELFAEFRAAGAGLGIAKTMKILCLKRPGLLPMLDSQVVRALHGGPVVFDQEKRRFAQQVFESTERFQKLMTWKSNRGTLEALSAAFTAEVSEHLTQIGVEKPHPVISPVRILDNLLWFDWWGYSYKAFGFRWYERENTVRRPARGRGRQRA